MHPELSDPWNHPTIISSHQEGRSFNHGPTLRKVTDLLGSAKRSSQIVHVSTSEEETP
jgi:hypothetical protein